MILRLEGARLGSAMAKKSETALSPNSSASHCDASMLDEIMLTLRFDAAQKSR
jgi:hypothetical protein